MLFGEYAIPAVAALTNIPARYPIFCEHDLDLRTLTPPIKVAFIVIPIDFIDYAQSYPANIWCRLPVPSKHCLPHLRAAAGTISANAA